MKNKALVGLIATATIGTAIATPTIMNNQNTTKVVNKVLMVNNSLTNEAVVINGNSRMNLYALSNGTGIVSNLSTGEMLTILGQNQNGYCKVRIQETGTVGYVSIANMQNILNGNNDSFTQLSGNGQVINVSSNVRLRSNPAIGNNIIGHLTNGTNLNILGKQGQWYKANVNGQVGFIYEEYVSTNGNSKSSVTSNLNNQASNSSSIISSSASSTSNVNSSNHVKNIIVKAKSSNSINQASNSNINKNNVTQVNKVVKIYLFGKNYINMSKTATGNYYYKIPSGTSIVKIISENSSDGMSYIEYNGHYGYVNTKALNVGENNYNQMKNSSNTN